MSYEDLIIIGKWTIFFIVKIFDTPYLTKYDIRMIYLTRVAFKF